ncbi:hypothetical protein [Streptomyces bluensis]|uniref:WXG100 family type VII secretion target n=1 Tax=Streptomyces bluensis TaxID=33897 RepID=A0ABW6UH04_9ACTN
MADFGYQDAFEADPARLQAAITEMQAIAKEAGAIANGFATTMGHFGNWYGIDDKYAEQVGPEWDREIETTTNTFFALQDAIAGTVDGRFAELEEIRAAQGFATESIAEARANLSKIGDFDGDTNGNGKR